MMLFNDETELHIKGLSVDWNKIAPYSYLREIPSIAGVEHLTFHKPITFFCWGEWQR